MEGHKAENDNKTAFERLSKSQQEQLGRLMALVEQHEEVVQENVVAKAAFDGVMASYERSRELYKNLPELITQLQFAVPVKDLVLAPGAIDGSYDDTQGKFCALGAIIKQRFLEN